MTSAVAVVVLTYRGHDIQDIDGIFLDLYAGGPGEIAEVRGVSQVIPGADGMLARNRNVQRRRIELRGFCRGIASSETTDRGDYWDNRITLADWFHPEQMGTLSATLPNGEVWTIEARTLPPIVYDQEVPSFARVSVVLESVDPHWVEQVGS